MVSGLIFGNAAEQFGQGIERNAARQSKNALLDRQLGQTDRKLDITDEANKQRTAALNLKTISEARQKIVDSAAAFAQSAAFDPIKVKGINDVMLPQLTRLLANEQAAKNPGSPLDPARAQTMAAGILQAATSGQTAAQKGAGEGRSLVAENKAIGEGLGQPRFPVFSAEDFNAKFNANVPAGSTVTLDMLTGKPEIKFPQKPLVQIGSPTITPEGDVTLEPPVGGGSGGATGGGTGGGAAGGKIPRLPGTSLDNLRSQILSTQSSKKILTSLIEQTKLNPENFGIAGSGRKALQTTASMAADIAKFANIDVRKGLEDVKKFLELDDIEDDAKKALTPTTVGAIDVLESQLIYSMARIMQPDGKLLKSTVDEAEKQVRLKGLTGSTQVRERLETILNQMNTREAELVRRIQQGTQGTTTQPPVDPMPGQKPLTADDLIRELEATDPGSLGGQSRGL